VADIIKNFELTLANSEAQRKKDLVEAEALRKNDLVKAETQIAALKKGSKTSGKLSVFYSPYKHAGSVSLTSFENM
jgi:hypothetical protein